MDNDGLTDEFGHSVTKNGGVSRSSSESKFGGYSAYFNGSGYLTIPDSDDWNFGTEAFTIDAWIRVPPLTDPNVYGIITQSQSIYTIINRFSWYTYAQGTMIQVVSGGSQLLLFYTGYTSFSPNTWYHVALIRGWGGNPNTWALTINGVVRATRTASITWPNLTGALRIGQLAGAFNYDHYFNGYIDELRVSKGVARWTSNFTPPSGPYGN
jgi:hypothetical protein